MDGPDSRPPASKTFPARHSGLALLAAAVMLALFACRASDPEPAASTISFDRLFDDLTDYDLVRITLKSEDGHTLDQTFYGKVVKASDRTPRS